MTSALRFEPERASIRRGATVVWDNTSAVAHTATDDPSLATLPDSAQLPSSVPPWDSGLIEPSTRWARRFDQPGSYTYFCVPHETAGMVGHLSVEA